MLVVTDCIAVTLCEPDGVTSDGTDHENDSNYTDDGDDTGY